MLTQPDIQLRTITDGAPVKDWLRVPHVVYQGDPAWIAPLHFQEKQRISPRLNPFFSFGTAEFFIAYRGGQPVGRISAQINRLYQSQHESHCGHFGFFDCIDDPAVAASLVDAASRWLKAQGADRMSGPFSLSINEECGLLIEGFEDPPALMMNHARPYAGPLLEAAGFTKLLDTFAYRLQQTALAEPVERLSQHARANPRITIRHLNMRRFDEEISLVIDIFNDAWSNNAEFVPFSDAELKHLARELKPFYRGEYGRIVSIDGEPVAMMLAMPDINALIRTFNGRLLPLNWLSLAGRLWTGRFPSARVPLLGIRKAHQHSLTASAVLALLIRDFLVEFRKFNLDWVEFSWVIEANKPMNALARLAAGAPVKRYRIYTKAL